MEHLIPFLYGEVQFNLKIFGLGCNLTKQLSQKQTLLQVQGQQSTGRVADHISAMGSSLCLSNIDMLEGCTDRSKRQITFEASANYETGDHIAVQPLNSDNMV